ncbi:MAG: YeiH family protein [Phycisphaerales bacterium]
MADAAPSPSDERPPAAKSAAANGAPEAGGASPRPVWPRIVFWLGVVACFHPMVSPAIALSIGLVLVFLLKGTPERWVSTRGAKLLLQVSVALLGVKLDLIDLAKAAAQGSGFAICTIAGTLALGYGLARLLRVARDTSTLISGGTAICGGSAIAAIAPAIGAGAADIAVAMATVFVLNGVGLYVFPIIGHMLELSPEQFGTWAGVAIHDVSSVVGAAKEFGGEGTMETATTVKLSRALWIVPVALGAGWWHRRRLKTPQSFGDEGVFGAKKRPPLVPWFIIAFVSASAIRTYVPAVAEVAPMIEDAAKNGLTVTLYLIGTSLTISTLRTVGLRPLLLGVLLWIAISVVSLVVVTTLLRPEAPVESGQGLEQREEVAEVDDPVAVKVGGHVVGAPEAQD